MDRIVYKVVVNPGVLNSVGKDIGGDEVYATFDRKDAEKRLGVAGSNDHKIELVIVTDEDVKAINAKLSKVERLVLGLDKSTTYRESGKPRGVTEGNS